MSTKFRIYSTEITPTLDPDTSWILPYNDATSDNVLFVVDETITGAGGATGTVLQITGTAAEGTLIISLTNDIAFVNGEILTGSIAGIADVNSVTGGTPPATLIEFDQDPLFGKYNPEGDLDDRGSVIQTIGSVVIQDFGVVVGDGVISFADTDALYQDTITALKTAYAVVDGEWYFTDAYNCWKIQFSRKPKGLKNWRNLVFSNAGSHVFSYEISLLIISKEI